MKIVDKALERFSLPPELAGEARVILSGARILSVENHRGLLEYSEDYILVAIKGGNMAIRGNRLSLAAMERESLVIRGNITGIDME